MMSNQDWSGYSLWGFIDNVWRHIHRISYKNCRFLIEAQIGQIVAVDKKFHFGGGSSLEPVGYCLVLKNNFKLPNKNYNLKLFKLIKTNELFALEIGDE